MSRYFAFALLATTSLLCLSCNDTAVVKTGSINVRSDDTVDFTQFKTFSVITADLVPPEDLPEIGEDEMAFNDMVNEIIIETMQAPPVCLTFIDPQDVTDEQPDLWAANGLARTTDGGYYYECVGGWWWGYWGWYWDSCASWYPVYVEYDVGNLLIPVGPPPAEGEEPAPIFAGLAQSIVGTGTDAQTTVRQAVQAIFQQWPAQSACAP
jgi:hypothetical protein